MVYEHLPIILVRAQSRVILISPSIWLQLIGSAATIDVGT